MQNPSPRLVVVPSDPIESYERAGYADWLERYYNPQGMFREVFALSPLETGERQAHGMTVIGVPADRFGAQLRRLRPAVVRAYGGYWPSDVLCNNRIPGVPIVVSIHDTNPALLHRSVCFADVVLCTSRVVAQRVTAIGTNPKRIRILPNRIDTKVFHPIPEDDSTVRSIATRFPKGKYVLHVGRKSDQKNLYTLIRALQALPAEYSCVFVGQGDRAPYVALAESLGVDQRCFWLDAIKNSELPAWYSWCDCMCTPSRWEGFGIVFIEAAACGSPIVTSDIAPMNEYLTHNVSAYLVKDYENAHALAAAIEKVCDDREYRNRISAGAIAAAQPFDRHIVDSAEAAFYRDAMELPSLSLSRRFEIAVWRTQSSIARRGASLKPAHAALRRIRRMFSNA